MRRDLNNKLLFVMIKDVGGAGSLFKAERNAFAGPEFLMENPACSKIPGGKIWCKNAGDLLARVETVYLRAFR